MEVLKTIFAAIGLATFLIIVISSCAEGWGNYKDKKRIKKNFESELEGRIKDCERTIRGHNTVNNGRIKDVEEQIAELKKTMVAHSKRIRTFEDFDVIRRMNLLAKASSNLDAAIGLINQNLVTTKDLGNLRSSSDTDHQIIFGLSESLRETQAQLQKVTLEVRSDLLNLDVRVTKVTTALRRKNKNG